MIDYRKLLRNERAKEEPDEIKLLYFKYKLGIMPIQITETHTFFDQAEKYEQNVEQRVEEINCKTFAEFLKNQNRQDIIINHHIFE
mgnify:FL=1